MLRYMLTLIFCLYIAAPALAEPEIKLTQRDLMLELVEGLGWSFGLPEQPEEVDYLNILNGKRTFRIEIEENYDPEVRVITEEIFSFGNYSGKGWIRVPNRPTTLSVKYNLPLSGNYKIKARLLKTGHTIRIGDESFTADGGNSFTDNALGTTYLQAGMQQITLTVPARGGIDFIEVEALPVAAIAPTGGWDLDAPLLFNDMAVTAMQLLGLHSALPVSGEDLVLEVEDFPLPKRTKLSTNRHLGSPSQGEWVSIGSDPVTLEIGVEVPTEGVYDLTVNCVGNTEISGTVNTQSFNFSPERRFTAQEAGGVTLKKGQTPLFFQLPPYCGLDQVVLSPRASSPNDFRRLTGLPLVGTPSLLQFNSFIKVLAAFGIPR